MAKKLTPEQEYTNACNELKESWECWNSLNVDGCSDPNYADGGNMNLKRVHISHESNTVRVLSNQYGFDLPPIFYRELPPQVSNDYMAKPDEIRQEAKRVLGVYLNDKHYQYMLGNIDRITDKKAIKDMCLDNILNYVTGLAEFIEEDNLVRMRTHRNPEKSNYSCLQSFRSGAKQMRQYLKETETLPYTQTKSFCTIRNEEVYTCQQCKKRSDKCSDKSIMTMIKCPSCDKLIPYKDFKKKAESNKLGDKFICECGIIIT